MLKKLTTYTTIILFTLSVIGCSQNKVSSNDTASTSTTDTSETASKPQQNTGASQSTGKSQVGSMVLKIAIGLAVGALISKAIKDKTDKVINDRIQDQIDNLTN